MYMSFALFLAGISVLSWTANAQCGLQTETIATSCDAHEVHVYLDKKTAPAGNETVIVAAEVLTDSMTNAPDGTGVTFVMQKEEGTIRVAADTQNGIAHARLDIGTVSGSAFIWAEIGELQSQKQELLILAGAPQRFKLSVKGCRSGISCQIQSTNLRDQFGNWVPDGLVGSLRVYSGGELISQQHVQTLNGTVLANWAKPPSMARVELRFGEHAATLEVPAP